jgi:hypothetical protein
MGILQVAHRCPHCKEHKDFVVHQFSEVMSRQLNPEDAPPLWDRDANGRIGNPGKRAQLGAEICALSRCPHCSYPVMFVALVANSAAVFAMSGRSTHADTRLIADFRVIATYPEIKPQQAHPTWPPEIAQIFNETRQFLAQGNNSFFVLAGCRSTLDVVTRELGATAGNLKERIDKLAADGKITAVLKNWAHKLRLDANEALHEGDTGKQLSEDPAQYVAFIELLLHMSFELEKEITERQPKVPPA